jgi:outer membrane receptor for ferric coprogen and ferric-rhodotorulic acid
MVSYRTRAGTNKVLGQLNIQNLLDKTYFENGGSFANYGSPRTVMASVKVDL